MNSERKKLTKFISYEEGQAIREQLHENALKEYKPTNSLSEYAEFMNKNDCTFATQQPQSRNHPWYFGLFSVVSQWVYGDCIEECLDRAMNGKDDRYFKEYMPGLKYLR